MPFLTEELWAIKGAEGTPRDTLLTLAEWPDLSGLEAPDAEAEIGWIVDLVSEVRSVRNEMNVPAGAQIPLVLVAASTDVVTRALAWDGTLRRLARLSAIRFEDAPPKSSAQMIVRGVIAALPLEGVIDIAAERARLSKELGKQQGEATKIEGKLSNADFVARAPEEVVEENRDRLAETLSQIEKIKSALERLGG
jgi:valyl-tRNA synthetase